MPIKVYKPTTPGRRKSSVNAFAELTVSKPFKKLTSSKNRISGRNNLGRITVRHRGGGAKRRFRQIDFKRMKDNVPGKVATIEYDPNRSAWIALVQYADGDKQYMLAPQQLEVGAQIMSSDKRVEITPGNRMPLSHIPIGSFVYNVELIPGGGAKMVRSAGASAVLMATDRKYATLKLPSNEIRKVPRDSSATIGMVSNPDHRLVRWGKAGRTRHRGRRPQVRGKVMNPNDHPHGGGEGRNSIGLKHPKTPWGKPALGVKTRKPKKHSNRLIVKRRKDKR